MASFGLVDVSPAAWTDSFQRRGHLARSKAGAAPTPAALIPRRQRTLCAVVGRRPALALAVRLPIG